MKKWLGPIPTKCDICEGKISSAFVDGRTTHGPWAIMCPECHRVHGNGLGTGRGQRYQYSPSHARANKQNTVKHTGEWLKTDG